MFVTHCTSDTHLMLARWKVLSKVTLHMVTLPSTTGFSMHGVRFCFCVSTSHSDNILKKHTDRNTQLNAPLKHKHISDSLDQKVPSYIVSYWESKTRWCHRAVRHVVHREGRVMCVHGHAPAVQKCEVCVCH